MSPKEQLQRAVALLNGQSALALAASAAGPKKVERQHIGNWLTRDEQVSAEYVLQVSAATGYEVTPHQLRPDLYPNPTDGLPQPATDAA